MDDLEHTYTLDQKEPPDPHRDGYVPYVWERYFFNAYITQYGAITRAASAAGITEQMVLDRANEAPWFKKDLEMVQAQLRDKIRHEIIRRALEPMEKIVYYRGKMVGVEYVYDNRHLEWVAERMMPNEFHLPSRVEFQADGDGDVKFKLELGPGGQEESDEASS